MNKPDKSKELLKRAYSLRGDHETHALYSDWADTYDQTMLDGLKYLTPSKTADLLNKYIKSSHARILDVGCGTGLAGEFLARLGHANIDGLDYSEEMLKTARTKKHGGKPVYSRLIEADLNKALQLNNETYDHLICTGTFTHAHVGAECIHELVRVMRPGGYFAFTVHKDVWEPGGFAEVSRQLTDSKRISNHHQELDIYFLTDTETQGWFILWEKIQ